MSLCMQVEQRRETQICCTRENVQCSRVLLRKTCTVTPCLGDQSGDPGSESYGLDVRRTGLRLHALGPSAPLSRCGCLRRFLLRELRLGPVCRTIVVRALGLKGSLLRVRRAWIEEHVSRPKSLSIRRRHSGLVDDRWRFLHNRTTNGSERATHVSSCTSNGCGLRPLATAHPPSPCCWKPASHLAHHRAPSASVSASLIFSSLGR